MSHQAGPQVVELRRFSRTEYHRLGAAGVLGPDERVELLDGMIVRVSPHGTRHATALSLCEEALRPLLPLGLYLRSQLPLAAADDSEPEPDLAVVEGTPRDYLAEHPRTALLVVEVAEESLEPDRSVKGRVYAAAGVPEYWIVNLVQQRLEVFRRPAPAANNAQGGAGPTRYQEEAVFFPADVVTPGFRPDRPIRVADLLP